jgi:hypothetical protein
VSGLIPVLILGTLILFFAARLLVQWSRRDHTKVVTIEDYTGARATVDSVFEETAAIKRIFADEDMEFISRGGTPHVQRFFLKERKELAIQWVRMTKRDIAHLMNLHLKLASYTYDPNPTFEFGLTANYLCFVLVSKALLILLWARGPFEAARIVGYTLRKAEHFCSVFSLRLEETDPQKLGAARESGVI